MTAVIVFCSDFIGKNVLIIQIFRSEVQSLKDCSDCSITVIYEVTIGVGIFQQCKRIFFFKYDFEVNVGGSLRWIRELDFVYSHAVSNRNYKKDQTDHEPLTQINIFAILL